MIPKSLTSDDIIKQPAAIAVTDALYMIDTAKAKREEIISEAV
jgi:hypothetical protein